MITSTLSTRFHLLLFIAWRNLWRNKTRSLLTITALGGGLAMLILYVALLDGMIKQMGDFATKISSGDIQIHEKAYFDDQDLYATIPWPLITSLESRFSSLRFSPRLYAAGLGSVGDISAGIMIRAVDPEKESHVTTMLSHLREGNNDLQQVKEDSLGNVVYSVIVGAQFAKNMNINLNDELIIISQAADGSIGNGIFSVSGILKPIELNFDRTGVLMSIQAYESLMYLESGAHEIAVAIPDQEDTLVQVGSLKTAIEDFKTNPAQIQTARNIEVRSWRELNPAVSDMMEVSRAAIYILGVIMVGLASMSMMNTMMMSIFERQFEFGILLAIGVGRAWLLIMVMLESLLISLVSALIGSALGLSGSWYLQESGIDMSAYMPDGFDFGGIIFEPVWRGYINTDNMLVSIFMMLIIALLASLIPSWKLTKTQPVDMLR